MVLSDTDILAAINSGEIKIDLFDQNRLNPASYTLSLGKYLLLPKSEDTLDAESPAIEYEKVEISEKGYVVNPGDFLLGSVAEKLSISLTLAAKLDARTSLARIGLNVLQVSTHIEPGQQGSNETLEINNIGPSPVRLRAGMKIVKVIFEPLQTPTANGYSGKYKGQSEGRLR